MVDSLQQLAKWIRESDKIVVLTGAGISTDSGIPDFRSQDGVWSDQELFRSMNAAYLRLHPDLFWPHFKRAFMSSRYLDAKPNVGHIVLQKLEEAGKTMTIITQNVDGLHQLAGSKRVLEVHGSAKSATCPSCHTTYDLAYILSDDIPRCNAKTPSGPCHTVLWPDVVLFDQAVHQFAESLDAVIHCDLMLVMGTSLEVHPVADLPSYRPLTTKLVMLNLEETPLDNLAELVIHARISDALSSTYNALYEGMEELR